MAFDSVQLMTRPQGNGWEAVGGPWSSLKTLSTSDVDTEGASEGRTRQVGGSGAGGGWRQRHLFSRRAWLAVSFLLKG